MPPGLGAGSALPGFCSRTLSRESSHAKESPVGTSARIAARLPRKPAPPAPAELPCVCRETQEHLQGV